MRYFTAAWNNSLSVGEIVGLKTGQAAMHYFCLCFLTKAEGLHCSCSCNFCSLSAHRETSVSVIRNVVFFNKVVLWRWHWKAFAETPFESSVQEKRGMYHPIPLPSCCGILGFHSNPFSGGTWPHISWLQATGFVIWPFLGFTTTRWSFVFCVLELHICEDTKSEIFTTYLFLSPMQIGPT